MKTYSIFASLLYTLSGIKLIIFSFGCNELVVISALDDTALFEYDDTIIPYLKNYISLDNNAIDRYEALEHLHCLVVSNVFAQHGKDGVGAGYRA